VNKLISYYISKSNIPYINQSIEEVLTDNIKPDQIILYLWQNDNTVVIGRNQNAWQECRLESFNENNGNLMRRITGGGAVYQDMGNQIFTFIAPPDLYDLDKQLEVVKKAVASFGLEAKKIGRNDILVDGRKFSGNAFRNTKNAKVQHGTILVNTDMSQLAKYLNPSKEKLESKGVTSVRSRVINLSDLNPDITVEKLQKELIKAFEEVYQQKASLIDDNDIDKKKLDELVNYYASDTWKLGPISEFNYEAKTRLSFGEIDLRLNVEKGIIKDAIIYSDALDSDWILSITNKLIGQHFNKKSIKEALCDGDNQEDINELSDYIDSLTL
jgi:lipoate-protein ligase A